MLRHDLIRDILFYLECINDELDHDDMIKHFCQRLENGEYGKVDQLPKDCKKPYTPYQKTFLDHIDILQEDTDFLSEKIFDIARLTHNNYGIAHWITRRSCPLSLSGYDYINSIREQEVWNQIKSKAKNLSLEAIFILGKELTMKIVRSKLDL